MARTGSVENVQMLRPDVRVRDKVQSRKDDLCRLHSGQVSAAQLYRENALVSAFAGLVIKAVVKRGKVSKP